MMTLRLRRMFAPVPFVAGLLAASPASANVAVSAFCHTIDSGLEEARAELPAKIGDATTMTALRATTGMQDGFCTFYGKHSVDTEAAAQRLVDAAHRGGQTSITLEDAYREMETDRYRANMIALMRSQVASNPLADRLVDLPGSLRDSVVMVFVYEFDENENAQVDPITLRLTPADIQSGR